MALYSTQDAWRKHRFGHTWEGKVWKSRLGCSIQGHHRTAELSRPPRLGGVASWNDGADPTTQILWCCS